MNISIDHSILQCPATKQDIFPADNDILDRVNNQLTNAEKFTAGLVNESKTIFYPIKQNILFLHQQYCIPLTNDSIGKTQMAFDKERIFNYYNEIKYISFEGKQIYEDADKWVDFRDFVLPYTQHGFSNVRKYIQPKGKYFADIASGPVAFKEYVHLADGYECRICIDISVNALLEAQYNLQQENQPGIFICADMLALPLKENVCDAVVCHHALFHVQKNLQQTAMNEMHRIAKPTTNIAIVYDWFYHSRFMNIALGPVQLYRIARHYAGKLYARLFGKNKLYFYSHSRKWFIKNNPGNQIKFYSWRSINKYFSSIYLHKKLRGKKLLHYIWNKEEQKPELMGRIGEYAVIVITK
ncbi:MAG: class I SAM-dependent methyltransferase [Sphingobacteriales bacterium]|nr:class I SAM-dependent methyltransferase [Sphingobacteriales bacterium]MBI3719034.1 class I SAM-dependent methyltransferase [Sphingobacteriales bacterium]